MQVRAFERYIPLNGFHRKNNHIARTQAICVCACVRARARVCVLQDLVSPAPYLTHMPFYFKYRTQK